MALTAGNLTNLRDTQHKSTPYLAVSKPAILLDAQVNGVGTRGARVFDYDNGVGTLYAEILVGMTVEITTAFGVEYVRLKTISGTNAAGTITLAENGITLPDNGRVVIRRKMDLDVIPPTIRNDVVYVDYDVAYTDQNSYPPPVCAVGWFVKCGWVPYTFIVTSASCYAMTQEATITTASFLATVSPSVGISIVNPLPGVLMITVTTAGEYLLRFEITDSNSRLQVTYRTVFGFDTNNPPYTGYDLSPVNGSWESVGYNYSLTPNGAESIDLTTIPDNTLVALWYDNTFNNVAGFVDLWGTANQNIITAGYLKKYTTNDDLKTGGESVAFEVVTPEQLLAQITELGSVSVNAVTTTPDKWYLYEEWLTVGRAIHYLLKWHTRALEVFEISGLNHNTLGMESAEFSESNVLQQINNLAWERGHKAKLCSNRWGGLVFASDAQFLQTQAERSALDVIFTITDADIDGPIDIVWQPERVVASAEANGYYYDGINPASAFISVIPAYQSGGVTFLLPSFRGDDTAHLSSQVLGGQTSCNRLVGRVYAYENRNPLELRFKTPRNYLGAFDIVPNFWYRWGVPDNQLSRALGLFNTLWLCREVSIVTTQEDGAIYCEVVLEPQVLGDDGVPGNYPTSYPQPNVPDIFDTGVTLAGYLDGAATDALTLIAIQLENDVFTLGPAFQLDSADVSFVALDNINNTTAIAFWLQADASMHVAHITRTALTLSSGAIVNLATTGYVTNYGMSVAVLEEDRFILVYTTALGSDIMAITGDLSGTTITLNTETASMSNVSPRYAEVVRLSATKALCVYVENPGNPLGSPVKVRVLNVAGDGTITPTAATTLFSGTGGRYIRDIWLISLTASKVAVALYYVDTTLNNSVETIILDIDGSDVVTFGTIYNIETNIGPVDGSNGYKGGYRIDDSTYVVIWRDDSEIVKTVVCEVSGTVVTVATPTNLTTTQASANLYPAIVYDPDLTQLITIFSDGTDAVGAQSATIVGAVITNDANNTEIAANGSLENLALTSYSKVL